jgi:hypothetical protein
MVDGGGSDQYVEVWEGLARTVQSRFFESEYIERFAKR